MKDFLRLVLWTIICYVLVFSIIAIVAFLQLWVSAAASVPKKPYIGLDELVAHCRWGLAAGLYICVLFSANYAQRNKVPAFLAFPAIAALCGALTFCGAFVLNNAGAMSASPYVLNVGTLGGPGLMLRQGASTIIPLDVSSRENGPRVTAIPGRPVIYDPSPTDENGDALPLPPVNFGNAGRESYRQTRADFDRSSREFITAFNEGRFSFLARTLPLLILLAALTYMFGIGAWPLANLFLCAAVFRGVLLFEVFLNGGDIKKILIDFIRGLLPDTLIIPVIIAVFAALVLIYDVLIYLAKERGRDGA